MTAGEAVGWEMEREYGKLAACCPGRFGDEGGAGVSQVSELSGGCMAAQALYRKWRSQTFEDLVGQEHVTVTLRNALREGRLSHAYLFAGPRGTGKTSTARVLAKAINCLAEDEATHPCNHCRICTAIMEGRQLDLIEIDAASNRGIDEIRDLREKINFRPNEARYKVYIIDEVHMLTKEAFNALLKTLEEPPPHAVFVLATTEPDRVPETVRSRCQRFDFRRIPTPEIVAHLATILDQENAKAAPEALVAVARRATGSMRDAISLLDQLLSYGDEVLELARVESVLGLVDAHTIGGLVDFMATGDSAAGLSLINTLVADGVELGELVDQIVSYLRGVLFVAVTRAPASLDVPQDIAEMMVRQARILTIPSILNALREFIGIRVLLRDQVPGVPQLPIEMAFLRSVLPGDATASKATSAVDVPAGAVPSGQRPATAQRPGAENSQVAQPTGLPSAAILAPAGKSSDDAPPGVGGGVSVATGGTDLGELARANWDHLVVLAGKRCGMKVQAGLRSVREVSGIGQTIVLKFAHAFSRDLVDQSANRVQVEALWEEILGRRVDVRCGLVGEAIEPQTAVAVDGGLPRQPQDDEETLLSEAAKLGAVIKPLA
jgi:DNA polymerase III subunit gamma/tau